MNEIQFSTLTVRELDVIRRVVQGRANKEIAKELNLAEITIKKYMQSIMKKLEARNRTHAAVLVVRGELVEQEDLGAAPRMKPRPNSREESEMEQYPACDRHSRNQYQACSACWRICQEMMKLESIEEKLERLLRER